MTQSTTDPAVATVAAIGERALIERIRQRAGAPPDYVLVGIGDDGAAIRPDRGTVTVVTTDSLVEDVHFRRMWTRAGAIGHKALAVNLSDIAAMGAAPRAALLSLALAPAFPIAEFDELIGGFLALAADSSTPLVGGNVSMSPGPLVVDTTVLGVAHPRKLLTRSSARPGDELYLTGSVGGAAAGLAALSADFDRTVAPDAIREAIERYERPSARWRCGNIVARSRAASAAIDLSDGLAAAARQLAEASGVGVELDADSIPIDPGMRAWAEQCGLDAIEAAIAGGEDYELLFAVPPRSRSRFVGAARRSRGLTVTRIGHVTADSGAWLCRGLERSSLPAGFSHLA